jgi:uncharacterized membrane protein
MSEALVILYVLGLWTVMITVVAVVLRWRRGPPTPESIELEELRARYARAEMTYEEYERRRSRIGRRAS